MMKLTEFHIGFPIIGFQIIVNYYTKRKPTAFEDIILQTVSKLKNHQSFSTMKLKDFLEEYLLIADSKNFVEPTINNLSSHNLISYSDEYNFDDLLLKDISITKEAAEMQRKGFIPTEDKQDKITPFWNPITNKILLEREQKFLLDNSTENFLTSADFGKEDIFPEQLIIQNIIANNLMEKFEPKRDEIRSIVNLKHNIEKYHKIKYDLFIDNEGNISIQCKDNSSELYSKIIDDISENKLTEMFTKKLHPYIETRNSCKISDYEIKEFIQINEFEKFIHNEASIKVVGDLNNLSFENLSNQKKQINIVFGNNEDDLIEFDPTHFNGSIFFSDIIPIANCIYLDDKNENIFNANFNLHFGNNSIITNQYFRISNDNFKDKFNSIIDKVERFIDEQNKISYILLKLFWKQSQEVWNEILQKTINHIKDDNLHQFKLVEQIINYSEKINEYGDSNIQSTSDINRIFFDVIQKTKNLNVTEIQQPLNLLTKYKKYFIDNTSLVLNLLKKIEKLNTIIEFDNLFSLVSGIKLQPQCSGRLVKLFELHIRENHKLVDNDLFSNIINITNHKYLKNIETVIEEFYILVVRRLSQSESLEQLTDIYKIINKSEFKDTIKNKTGFSKDNFPLYERLYFTENFYNKLKNQSDLEIALKKMKQADQNLAKIFNNSNDNFKESIVDLIDENSIKTALVNSDSISKIASSVTQWINNFSSIQSLISHNSKLIKINNNIKSIKTILRKYTNDIPQKFSNVYLLDTNVFIDKPDILDLFNQKRDYILLSKKVIDELDKFKISKQESQKAIKSINTNKSNNNIVFEESDVSLLPIEYNKKNPDNQILSIALKYKHSDPIIITSDINFQNKAYGENIKVMSLKQFLSKRKRG